MLEFSEVESGIFEAPKPGEGILFIQNPTDLGPAPKTAEQITGDWTHRPPHRPAASAG